MTQMKPKCLLSGASGYLGGLIKQKLIASGWDVVALSRKPKAGEISYVLGDDISPDVLRGHDALIHCAYDFAQIAWADIERVNVVGSQKLLRAANEAGIPRMLLISTISAFDGCKSRYGKAKLLMEQEAFKVGATVIRPGLIYGPQPGAMFGRLVSQVRGGALVPMPGDGRQMMFTVHQDDLTESILQGLSRSIAVPITVANSEPIAFRDIMIGIGKRLGKKVTPIPLPWRLMWLGIRGAEVLRVPLGLRSDSLVSLVNQDVSPNLNVSAELGVTCRPFDLNAIPLGT